jgi:hypothetical protein
LKNLSAQGLLPIDPFNPAKLPPREALNKKTRVEEVRCLSSS